MISSFSYSASLFLEVQINPESENSSYLEGVLGNSISWKCEDEHVESCMPVLKQASSHT